MNIRKVKKIAVYYPGNKYGYYSNITKKLFSPRLVTSIFSRYKSDNIIFFINKKLIVHKENFYVRKKVGI